ncbi:hypothetical protein HHX38_11930 [Streptomyces sp. PKU-MA01144]|uniref:hypothetical protein n=1 Tax=Streptomyces sp. PKU-MA01144 TaxID=2729138 RepID=UPI00147C79D0|nr:hypothetical protein [Streptomyces sp. PKU-MA01144]NNJ04839.1 hypothetical protein [Streptomyces sp. PKU-MA01144]
MNRRQDIFVRVMFSFGEAVEKFRFHRRWDVVRRQEIPDAGALHVDVIAPIREVSRCGSVTITTRRLPSVALCDGGNRAVAYDGTMTAHGRNN